MQKLVRFWMTLNFDGKYLWNRFKIFKIGQVPDWHDSSRIWWKKPSEPWSSNHWDL